MKGKGKNIVVGTVVKAKTGELEEVRSGCLRRTRKDLNSVRLGASKLFESLQKFSLIVQLLSKLTQCNN